MIFQLAQKVLPWIITPGLLIFLWFRVDGAQALARLGDLHPGWLIAGVLLASGQVVLSALRWRLTARHVGITISKGWSIREYFLGTLLNQLLPGGVGGDLFRAWRHGRKDHREQSRTGFFPSLRVVMIERSAGYLALLPFAAAGAYLWVPKPWNLVAGTLLLAVLGVLVVLPFQVRHLVLFRGLSVFFMELRTALLVRGVWERQLFLSLLILASYVLVFACSAYALQVPMAPLFLVTAVPLVLLSMAVPFTIAGWGVREVATVGLWGLSGHSIEEGLAVSIGYGLLVLLGALPGALVLLIDAGVRRQERRSRSNKTSLPMR
ncbi:lysylphosphatidylglycerol synthase transmembrane domain-containing protein [Fodinicurvata fenggangensis]|uniref:lysylphosphatidylglycerol synthase transmembrane domain-containing protein n=1 Tax=Fodinicurvata fenggangensis TaxID=1121830 RepID=UPI00068FCCAB|nr:lysylphosphatidylglycerol synthase transmembrane domain-containing protein [Fodinicurvata fenggangensis]